MALLLDFKKPPKKKNLRIWKKITRNKTFKDNFGIQQKKKNIENNLMKKKMMRKINLGYKLEEMRADRSSGSF